MGKLKNTLLEQFNKNPFYPGATVLVKDSVLFSKGRNEDKTAVTVIGDNGDDIIVKYKNDTYTISKNDAITNDTFVGVNPFQNKSWRSDMSIKKYAISFIINSIGAEIDMFNFNPYIKDKAGNKVYYQRELCWTLEDKQNFLESVYNDLNCGDIVLKLNGKDKFNETKCEYDVIDGKQRLNTIIEFVKDEFPDKNGHYWSDFSTFAQRMFKYLSPFSFYEFREDVSDEKIKQAFLNVNHTGVEMSREHIEFVKSIEV